ncbi:hypothetical protein EIN_118100 [Entamoeba invadens IP1]|uniref:Nbr1 FW domain-containing protein n=1 Tax=Entamoeba invadens IP1 TaxID=370355 RepID=L7FNP0_ENTIV|nr:hypothetical protein EIN_118100 [Entamoeba invadens IP1]ELP92236.1 hypothetical protein EIN_118100 [Entamoeba invadens IP1]|eukprot:XP_004259007.1 hypothetical protein EIN_118100 [Entamoeba invadens IP1]
MEKQFLVDAECGKETHRVVIDQTVLKWTLFQKRMSKAFRQLPPVYVMIYCGVNGTTLVNDQETYLKFYVESFGIVKVHLGQKERLKITKQELVEWLTKTVAVKCLSDKERKEEVFWSELSNLFEDNEVQHAGKVLVDIVNKKCKTVTQEDVERVKEEEKELTVKYHMVFLRHVTFIYPTNVKKMTKHIKVWRVKNNGNWQWPKGCYVGYWNGTKISPEKSTFPIQPIIGANQIEVAFEFSVENEGNCSTECRLFTPDGLPFGDVLKIDCVVI